MLLVGDLNLPRIDWTALLSPNDKTHKPFLSFVIESSYSQLVDFPTIDSSNNVLDVILSNNPSIVTSIRPDIPLGASDHVIIHFSIALADDYSHYSTEQNYSRNWLSADYDAIELYLSSVDWFNLVALYPSAADLWDVFMSTLYTVIDLYVPKRAVSNSSVYRKPYLRSTRELRKCAVKKRCLWRKLRASKHDTALRLKYRECVYQWRRLIQQQQEKTEEYLIEANSIGSFYKFVNKRLSLIHI